MREVLVSFKGMTPYSPSKYVDPEEHPKKEKEKPDDYELRLWREKATFDAQGRVCIPSMALKMAVDEAVKRLGVQVVGRGKTTYTKYFVAGQICDADVPIGVTRDELQPIRIWANADGVRGSGKRVKRIFPYVQRWGGVACFHVLDPMIPQDVFEKAVIEAGRLIGVGRFRPEKGGMNGRFIVTDFTWSSS